MGHLPSTLLHQPRVRTRGRGPCSSRPSSGAAGGAWRALDVGLLALALICLGYYMIEYLPLVERAGAWTVTDTIMSGCAVLLALEAARH